MLRLNAGYNMSRVRHFLFLLFVTSFFLGIRLINAQTPIRIHDLKSITDSSGVDHLFYRIYAEYEGTEYSTDNIYHYNTATSEEEVFLESFYDTRFGFPYAKGIVDYKFLDNDPQNYVYVISYSDGEFSQYTGRPDSVDLFGGLFVSIDNLNVEGTDTGRVYIEAFGETIIGKNGGRDWPEVNEENGFEIPDSSILHFPLVSLSPYNDSLMFGIHFRFGASDNRFVRSIDRGNSEEIISDTLFGSSIVYDSNSSIIYLIDTIGVPGSGKNCSIEQCDYGLYRNLYAGERTEWVLLETFANRVELFSHPSISGKLYVWNNDQILVSSEYGDNVEILIDPVEDLTGFTATTNRDYYSTFSTVYGIKDGVVTEITSIPVSNEPIQMVPTVMELHQNYPNPFNPSTNIKFEVPNDSHVELVVFDVLGRKVAELVNEFRTQGTHSIPFDASSLSSGVYLYQIKVNDLIVTKQMTLIK